MLTDFSAIEDGEHITLYPNDDNPIHKTPIGAFYQSGYFYCDGTDPCEWPDYYLGDVSTFCVGYDLCNKDG